MKLLRWSWNYLEEFLGGICLTAIVILISINVFLRYVLNSPVDWINEAATILFVWTVMFGIGAGTKRRLHPTIDVFTRLIPEKTRIYVEAVINILVIALLTDCTLRSWHFAWGLGLKKFTGMMELPYTVVYLALPIGFGLMLIRVITCFVSDIRALKNRGNESKMIQEKKVEEVI